MTDARAINSDTPRFVLIRALVWAPTAVVSAEAVAEKMGFQSADRASLACSAFNVQTFIDISSTSADNKNGLIAPPVLVSAKTGSAKRWTSGWERGCIVTESGGGTKTGWDILNLTLSKGWGENTQTVYRGTPLLAESL